ncbi:GNAT family N-acetyltransferase [Holosporaceae bacterium 'Namur']|nr:GNAT family N-acetyltransferase [Holosporaceae bacterium 'Namur']
MRVERFNPVTHTDIWNSFLAKAKNSLFMFDRSFMEYHSDRFHDHSLLFFEEGRLVALLPANEKERVLFSHSGLTFGGVITDQAMKAPKMLAIFGILNDYLKTRNFKKLIYKAIPYIYHTLPAQEDLYALFYNNAKCYRYDLTTTIDLTQPINFSERRRRGIKKAQKSGIIVKESHDLESYFLILSSLLHEKYNKVPVHNLNEIELLASRFPENIKLYAAFKEEIMIAGVLIFEYQQTVHAQYIGSSHEGKQLHALDLVFHYLITKYYTHKRYFDFGISTEEEGMYLNHGLITQKEEFGGRAVVHQFFELDISA